MMWSEQPRDPATRRLELLSSGSGANDGSLLLTCESDPKNYLGLTENCVTCEDYFYAD